MVCRWPAAPNASTIPCMRRAGAAETSESTIAQPLAAPPGQMVQLGATISSVGVFDSSSTTATGPGSPVIAETNTLSGSDLRPRRKST